MAILYVVMGGMVIGWGMIIVANVRSYMSSRRISKMLKELNIHEVK